MKISCAVGHDWTTSAWTHLSNTISFIGILDSWECLAWGRASDTFICFQCVEKSPLFLLRDIDKDHSCLWGLEMVF
jgi:hypothetical protein